MIKVSVIAAPLPLPSALLIPATTARVQLNVAPTVALVAVYVVDTLLHWLCVRLLFKLGEGLIVTVTFCV